MRGGNGHRQGVIDVRGVAREKAGREEWAATKKARPVIAQWGSRGGFMKTRGCNSGFLISLR